MTRRLRLDLGYDGTDFRGWAAQPGLRTVQGEVEAALAMASREDIVTTVAGRTDAGVHARHQVCHADISEAAWTRLSPRGGESDDEAVASWEDSPPLGVRRAQASSLRSTWHTW